MAMPLYARYFPPKPQIQTEARKSSKGSEQAHKENSVPLLDSKLRKRKREDLPELSRKRKSRRNNSVEHHGPKVTGAEPGTSQDKPALNHDIERKVTNAEELPELNNENHAGNGPTEHRKKKKRKKETNEQEPQEDGGDEVSTKHSNIISKYEKSAKRRREVDDKPEKAEVQELEKPELHDLVPIPMPEAPAQPAAQSVLSALPTWLSKPVSIPAGSRVPFKDLNVDFELCTKLKQNGFDNALPVQAGILPLLLPIPTQHPGDLCVSAATGSGKTVGYVLPVVQSLVRHRTTDLRALIVVPTRELVDQVRETVAMCLSRTKLQVGTAVGSQNLESEQAALVEKSRRYDPVAYKVLREKLERRLSYNEEDFESDDNENDNDDDDDHDEDAAEELSRLLPNHVPTYASKVDILIATPGRLVEHIKSTPGFSLANLEWLVIDEADRLLDESFQEWVDTLTSAITGGNAMRWKNEVPGVTGYVPKAPPRKVVLSATMTRDLDKLSGLQLRNPKLVVVDGAEEESVRPDVTEDYRGAELPSTLEEYAIPAGSGAEKPLYLQYLMSRFLRILTETSEAAAGPSEHSGSSDFSDDDLSSSADSSSTSDGTPRSLSPPTSDQNALVFVSTNESAHRLSHLLAYMLPKHKDKISTLTKSSTSRTTLKALASFRASNLRVLIATDRASRGLDLTNLGNVINYDIPHSITSYIHRVGRTARAGKHGRAWTLVEDREAAWFWKEVAKGDGINRAGRTVQRKRVDVNDLGLRAAERYRSALAVLQKDVKGGASKG